MTYAASWIVATQRFLREPTDCELAYGYAKLAYAADRQTAPNVLFTPLLMTQDFEWLVSAVACA